MLILATQASQAAKNRQVLLTPKNVVNFRGPVNTGSVLTAQLRIAFKAAKLEKGEKLYLVIDSPGGSIDAGEDLIQFIKNYPNVQVVCMFCASMAHAILQAVDNKRLIVDNSLLMAHRARIGGIGGQIEEGEVESRLAMIKAIVRKMEKRNAARIGIPLKEYKDKVKDEWWLTSLDAIRQNHADEVVDLKCSKKLMKTGEKFSIRTFGGVRTFLLSACPLVKGIIKEL